MEESERGGEQVSGTGEREGALWQACLGLERVSDADASDELVAHAHEHTRLAFLLHR